MLIRHDDFSYQYVTSWVASTGLPHEQRGTHKLYNPSASTTALRAAGEKFSVNYSFEGASGYVVQEHVDIGGTLVIDMPVGVATKLGPRLVNETLYDGILGLAFKSGNSSKSSLALWILIYPIAHFQNTNVVSQVRPHQAMTLMEYAQAGLDEPVFTVNLRPDNQEGALEFGYIDPSLYSGRLIGSSVNNVIDGSWTVTNVIMMTGNFHIVQDMLFGTSPSLSDFLPSPVHLF